MTDAQDPVIESTSCIICGQKHDQSFLKPPANSTPQKTSNIWSGIALLIGISIVVAVMGVFADGYAKRIRMETTLQSEMNMVTRLQTIAQAEVSFRQTHKRYGTIDELVSEAKLRKKWEIPIRDGYYFHIKFSADSIAISARPTDYASDQRRSFISYIDGDGNNESSAIYGADKGGGEANRSDELLEKSLKK